MDQIQIGICSNRIYRQAKPIPQQLNLSFVPFPDNLADASKLAKSKMVTLFNLPDVIEMWTSYLKLWPSTQACGRTRSPNRAIQPNVTYNHFTLSSDVGSTTFSHLCSFLLEPSPSYYVGLCGVYYEKVKYVFFLKKNNQ